MRGEIAHSDCCVSLGQIHAKLYDNGVAGLHVLGSNNFTFEATIRNMLEDPSQGSVGSVDGQQPIEIRIESSSLLTFTDMRVLSVNGGCMALAGCSRLVQFSILDWQDALGRLHFRGFENWSNNHRPT